MKREREGGGGCSRATEKHAKFEPTVHFHYLCVAWGVILTSPFRPLQVHLSPRGYKEFTNWLKGPTVDAMLQVGTRRERREREREMTLFEVAVSLQSLDRYASVLGYQLCTVDLNEFSLKSLVSSLFFSMLQILPG